MIIKIDIRETGLLHLILQLISEVPSFQNIKVKTETLPIGDVIIHDETEDRIIIERKSINDLLASIKDGRYEEQSYRLNGTDHHNHNIIYLIEGDVNSKIKCNTHKYKTNNEQLQKQTLYSAMFSLNYYKGFSVFRSFSLNETANIICNMTYKLSKNVNKSSFYKWNNPIKDNHIEDNHVVNPIINQQHTSEDDNETNQTTPTPTPTDKDYVSVIKKIKKDNITPDNIGEIMLCQIPGVSSVTALAIMNKYNTLPNLIKELETNHQCMNDFTYLNTKGQSRKINKTCISNIVKFLLKK